MARRLSESSLEVLMISATALLTNERLSIVVPLRQKPRDKLCLALRTGGTGKRQHHDAGCRSRPQARQPPTYG